MFLCLRNLCFLIFFGLLLYVFLNILLFFLSIFNWLGLLGQSRLVFDFSLRVCLLNRNFLCLIYFRRNWISFYFLSFLWFGILLFFFIFQYLFSIFDFVLILNFVIFLILLLKFLPWLISRCLILYFLSVLPIIVGSIFLL